MQNLKNFACGAPFDVITQISQISDFTNKGGESYGIPLIPTSSVANPWGGSNFEGKTMRYPQICRTFNARCKISK